MAERAAGMGILCSKGQLLERPSVYRLRLRPGSQGNCGARTVVDQAGGPERHPAARIAGRYNPNQPQSLLRAPPGKSPGEMDRDGVNHRGGPIRARSELLERERLHLQGNALRH